MIEVACAIIVDVRGKVLVAQRGADMRLPLKMEFPGGKLEPGETPEMCIKREIREELNLDIEVIRRMPANQHAYSDFSIHLMPFVCRIIGGSLVLREHAAYIWSDTAELMQLDWAEADIPIVKFYLAASALPH